MQKVFVTGSEGFVGQHLVAQLKNKYSIIGLSRNTQLEPEKDVEYVLGDILNQENMFHLLEKYQPEIIVHLAGVAKTWNNDPKEVFEINLFGTINLYEAVLQLKKTSNYDPKIVFISSAEVYGKTTDTKNITEKMLLYPINEYGSSKSAADRASFQYTQTHNLNIVILRPFPHIGPGQKTGFFVPDMASQIIEVEKDPQQNKLMVGNLQAVKDYLDVRDVVQAYQLAIETHLPTGEVFNISSGKGVKIEDILNKLLSLTNKQIDVVEDKTRIRAVDLTFFIGNNQKFTQATGWKPTFSLDQSLRDVMDYWRNLNR